MYLNNAPSVITLNQNLKRNKILCYAYMSMSSP